MTLTSWVPYQGKPVTKVKARTRPAKRSYPERDLVHRPLIKWAKCHPVLKDHLIHIPNDGRRSPMAGAMLKALGMYAGVSDLFLLVPVLPFSGYWLELKAPGKRPTPEQKAFLLRAKAMGYAVGWFDDWLKAKESIERYLSGDHVCTLR